MNVITLEIILVTTVWIFRRRTRNLSSGAHVFHTTSNLVNSRRCKVMVKHANV